MSLAGDGWIRIQQKTFTRWMNTFSVKKGFQIEDVTSDFNDGIKLIKFMEAISNEPLGKFDLKPKMKIQKIQNINVALNFIASKNVKLIGVAAEEIHDGNLKMILGMIWTLIMKYQVEDITEGELTAKEALLLWVKRKTKGYRDVNVENFHLSFQDGMALCALIHAHRPNLIPYDSLSKQNKAENLQMAFDIAEKHLGVAKLLDVEDIVDSARPDEKSMMAYVAQLYHVFSGDKKGEIAGRRIGNLVDFATEIENLKSEYNLLSNELINWMKKKIPEFQDRHHEESVESIVSLQGDMTNYKAGEKIDKNKLKLDLEAKLNSLNLKLRSNNRGPFLPGPDLSLERIDELWTNLEKEEFDRDEWLQKELERQKELNALKTRFDDKAAKLEAWIAAKDEYLRTDESVNSLREAQSKLKKAEAFTNDYKLSETRVHQVQELANQILALDPKATDVSTRIEKIKVDWHGLKPKHDSKIKDLQEKLALEKKKEALRIEFADKAKDYVRWAKEASNTLSGRNFGQTLEAVQEYEKSLKSSDSTFISTSEEKKALLDHLWNQLQELGVKDNNHTVMTKDDVANTHQKVLQDIEARRKAWEDELERQLGLEEKRKEFAKLADEFIASLKDREAELKANHEPEPATLIEQTKQKYNGGAPEKEKLKSLQVLSNEMIAMGITSNRHTRHTMPSLTKDEKKFVNKVRDFLKDLRDEWELKNEFGNKAKELKEWIASTMESLEAEFENTLESALRVQTEWNLYKSRESAEHGIDLINLKQLFKKIGNLLTKNHRPKFEPESPYSPDELDALFAQLSEAEDKCEATIRAEVARQEKISALVRRFNIQASDLESFLDKTEGSYKQEAVIHSLNEARLQTKLLQLTKDEVKSSHKKLQDFLDLKNEIENLNYHDVATVNKKASEISHRWESLTALASVKAEKIENALGVETGKEELRMKFADQARDLNRFIQQAKEKIGDHYFGSNLAAVKAYREKLDQSDNKYNAKIAELKAALVATQSELDAQNVSDNRHTELNMSKIGELEEEFQSVLQTRRDAYAHALEAENGKDTKAEEFAKKMDAYVQLIENKKTQIEALNAEPEEMIESINDIYAGGNENNSKFEELKAANATLQSEGIFENPHTNYTMSAVEGQNKRYNAFVTNYLAALEEDKGLAARKKEQQAEIEKREKLEKLQNEFDTKSSALAIWMEEADDWHIDAISAKTVQDVEKSKAEYDVVAGKISEQSAIHEQLVTLAKELEKEGVTVDVESVSSKFHETLEASKVKYAAYKAEHEKQQENEALRKEFAQTAESFASWLTETRHKGANAPRDLDQAIDTFDKLVKEAVAGKARLEKLAATDQKLDEREVFDNPHTTHSYRSLKTFYEQVCDGLSTSLSQAEKEKLLKENTGVSPEQLAEYRETFNHFDKEGNGKLTLMEFFGVLKALGEEVASEEDCVPIFKKLDKDNTGEISFQEFTNYMIEKDQDKDTADQMIEAFQMLAEDRPHVTEEDMRKVLDGKKVDYLVANMPKVEGGYDYKAFIGSQYM